MKTNWRAAPPPTARAAQQNRVAEEHGYSRPVIQCNCSICSRTGTLLAFVPPGAFKLEKGEDNLSDYQFNKKVIHHLFCKTCGARPFGRGEGPNGPMVAVNTRCLDDVDVATLNVRHFDGKSL